MSWEKEVQGIEQRRQLAQELGGPEAVAKQHERGRVDHPRARGPIA